MIVKDEMFTPMLQACPFLLPVWEAFRAEWADEADKPYYIALGEFADHLVERFRLGETADFPAIFDVVERWHLEGDAYVREAATIGLLESLQTVAGNNDLDPASFEPWLKPETRKWWDRLNRFWADEPGALSEDS